MAGKTVELQVLIDAANYSIKLIECDLCHNKFCLGVGRSTCSFLSHRDSGTCQKTIARKEKQSMLDAEQAAITEA